MLRRRYEILLPLQFNDGIPVPDDALHQTREEVVSRFDGVSISPGTITGIWIQEGVRYEDSLVRLVVDVEDTVENRQFFVEWKSTLLQRFQPTGAVHHIVPHRGNLMAEVIDAALKEEPALTFQTAGVFKRALEEAG
jgi:hypothetical protein